MKKALSIILAVILLCMCLSGCQSSKTNPADIETTDVAAKSDTPYFSLKELPDIGGYVSGDIVDYFFEDGPHKEFTPGSDYGTIMPYVKETKLFESPEYYTYTDDDGKEVTVKQEYKDHALWTEMGLATTDGKIITEPFFSSFTYEKGVDGKDFYILSDESGEGLKNYTVAADGSWFLEFDGYPESICDDYYLPDNGFYISCYEKYSQGNTVKVYDLDGNLIIDKQLENSKDYFTDIRYYNDEYYLFCSNYNSMNFYCICCDKDGNEVRTFNLGGGWPEMRYENIFPMRSNAEETVTLFDTNGNAIKKISNVTSLRVDQTNSRLLVSDGENIRRIDKNGEVTERFKGDLNCFCYAADKPVFIDTENKKVYSAVDGKEIILDAGEKKIKILDSRYGENNEMFIFAIYADGCAGLFDTDGKKICDLEKTVYVNDSYPEMVYTETFIAYIAADNTVMIRNLTTGKEQKVDCEINPEYTSLWSLNDSYLQLFTAADKKGEIRIENVYSTETGELLFRDVSEFSQCGENYVCATLNGSWVFDKDGNTLIKITNNNMY